jgi:SAM-dependent methyltransferase
MSKEILDSHREIWNKRRLTRYLYNGWYRDIKKELSARGLTIELGAGTGNFKEFMPESVSTDLVWCEWLDMVHDASVLPYRDGTVGNFVLIDAIHHINDPVASLSEMERCLKKGGRVIILDVFISPFSYLYYNYFHKEEVDLSADLFDLKDGRTDKKPFESNQAIATLLFFRQLERYSARFPRLRPVKREVREFLLYPMSGGFEGAQLAPFFLKGFLSAIDRAAIKTLGRLVAGRCLVVLEKA